MQTQSLFSEIEKLRNEMTQTLMELIRIPAIAPESDGEGETKKAEKLIEILKALGFDEIQRFDADDERVPSKKRPNIITYCNGKTDMERLWIVTHIDIVPPGEESRWTITKPFEPTIKGERIYGRGSEDNAQSLISSIFAAKALKNLGIKPERTIALCFVADEEQGSVYGIRHLIKQGIFNAKDLVVVPDGGNETGSFIETAEKSVLWLRIRTFGKQSHASRPDMGLNANRIRMQYILALDKMLHEKYPDTDENFDPPKSTFEPTRKDKNVDAVNIIPGEDTNYLDCRILPHYDVGELLRTVHGLAAEFIKKTGAEIKIEEVHKTIAPQPTDVSSRIVVMMREAIMKVRGIEPKVGGIGGGTCAAYFREAGVPAIVWSTIDELAHLPNEYAKIENLVNDAKIFAYLATASI